MRQLGLLAAPGKFRSSLPTGTKLRRCLCTAARPAGRAGPGAAHWLSDTVSGSVRGPGVGPYQVATGTRDPVGRYILGLFLGV
eukprot:521341-Hanusia_phi.AAC.1